MTKRLFPISILLLALFIPCVSSGAGGDVKKSDYSSEFKEAPKWVFNPQDVVVDKGFIAAVGVAKVEGGDIEGAKKRAFKIAVQEMAMKCAAKVKSLMKGYIATEIEKGVPEGVEMVFRLDQPTSQLPKQFLQLEGKRDIQHVIHVEAPTQLLEQFSQAEEKRHWVSPSGDLYLLAVINKHKIKKINLKQDVEWKKIVKSYQGEGEGEINDIFSINEDDIWTDLISYEGTNDVADKDKVLIPLNKAGAPEWVMNREVSPQAGEALSGVGSASFRKPGQIGASLLAARARARNDLAERVEETKGHKLSSFTERSYIVTDSEGKKIEKPIERSAKTVINASVSSSQRDLWVSPNGEIFVLVTEEDSGAIAGK